MADPDQTLVTDDDDAPKAEAPSSASSSGVGPSGTMVGDDAGPLPPEATVASPLMDAPEAQAPVVTRPMPELSAARAPAYGGAATAIALGVTLVLAAAGGYAIVNAELDPPAKVERPRVATPPPPPPVVAASPAVEKRHERPVEVVLPSKPPPPGTVTISTSPETRVSVEGKSYGEAPVTVVLPAGRNTVVLENASLALKQVVTIEVKPNGRTEERFSFAKGWLRVAAPRGTKISVDGKAMTPPMNEVEVWEGHHRVDVVHADKEGTHESQIAVVRAGKIAGVFFEPPRDGVATTRAVMVPTRESRTRTTR